ARVCRVSRYYRGAVKRRRRGNGSGVPATRRRPRDLELLHGPAVGHAERQPAAQPRDLRRRRLGGEPLGVELRHQSASTTSLFEAGARIPVAGAAN
ncbi:unnamed protein product, partial [Urochloa humidicola]